MGKLLLMTGIATVALTSVACSDLKSNAGESDASKNQSFEQRRWFSQTQVAQGETVYQKNCISCHGENASGASNWREADASGKFPPPPLDGTAHAWHHPKSMLRMTIERGGIPIGGSMPAFREKLSHEETDAVIAYFQSHWSDEIYTAWAKRNAQAAWTGTRQ
ncbi:MAG: c-type cytochrome [Thiotrichales bacterium]